MGSVIAVVEPNHSSTLEGAHVYHLGIGWLVMTIHSHWPVGACRNRGISRSVDLSTVRRSAA
jgi:hypothetical protein